MSDLRVMLEENCTKHNGPMGDLDVGTLASARGGAP
jgi:hypothetical protein